MNPILFLTPPYHRPFKPARTIRQQQLFLTPNKEFYTTISIFTLHQQFLNPTATNNWNDFKKPEVNFETKQRSKVNILPPKLTFEFLQRLVKIQHRL